MTRRRFLQQTASLMAASFATGSVLPPAARASSGHSWMHGDNEVFSLSDGHLALPVAFVVPDTIDAEARNAFLSTHQLGPETLTPDCNVTLLRTPDRLVLFDVGGGSQFVSSTGLLLESLASAGFDPQDITDVLLTHAHPDHLWGALDDFDDLTFPEATFHINRVERDYWLADDTLDKTPDERKSFVVGAQNRLGRLDEQLVSFEWGQEVLPGIEAVDTHGHTPGHTAFALHSGSDSVMVLGDALTQSAISFERPAWPNGADQQPEQGIQTRLSLLDRLANDDARFLGFHLPVPGMGRVERSGEAYRYIALE